MKFKSLAVLVSAAVATALSSAPLTHASDGAPLSINSISAAKDESPSRWFVELAGPPTIHGVTPAAVGRERAAFRQAASAAGIEFKDRFQYETLWNGLSIEASFANAAKLRAVPGVKAVFPVINIEAPVRPDPGSVGHVEAAIALTGVDIARADLGLTGKGIKVAIIDTGIDYDHPDLGGCFGPGCKVAYGYDFVGDAYNSVDPDNNVPVPDDDPDDCGGHGTHVAGIVGAKAAGLEGVTGVAPDVTLGAYRVFGCVGSSSADVIIAALERAYADGMHVINQSLGAAFQWPQYPTATVGDRLVELGVVVVASAGNSGSTGTFSIDAPGVGKDVIGVASFNNESVLGAGLISGFSSWGLSPDLALKPDLGAPGGSIYSTYPVELGSYATLSGTSMSAPHVAGAVAMLLEAKPDTRAADVRDLLQNTAQPRAWSRRPAQGLLDAVARQGAGMIDIAAAVKNTVHVSPGKLSLGESEAGRHLVSLTVANNGDEDVTFTLGAQTNTVSVTRAIALNSLNYRDGFSAVEFDKTSVTVPAGGSAKVSATIVTAGLQDYLYGGYITLTSEDTTLRVPYAGFLGDYQLMKPLSENFDGFPWLATLENERLHNQPEGASFSMEGGDVPYILYNLYHPVRRMEVSIIDAATERPVHPVFSRYFAADYLGRNSTDVSFFTFVFDGTREHSAGNSDLFKVLANGDYKVTISVLKALGDASNPDHWETWTSPPITIARPEEPKKKTINLRGNGR